MRTLLFFILGFATLHMQGQPENLKKTLTQAEEKYQVSFTYDDRFISRNLAFEATIPDNLNAFLDILQKEYLIQISRKENDFVLSPAQKYTRDRLCGYVKSQRFNSGISDILIVNGKQFTFSDSEGYFSFEYAVLKRGVLELKTRKSGTVIVDYTLSETCEDYYVDNQEIKLGEVIVEYIIPPIEKSSNGAYTISLQTLTTSPGSVNPDLLELLQLLPGVSSPNENNAIFIRGGTPDQNKINWNAIRVYQNHHANGGLSSLNPFGIDKMELMVKGVPAMYGEHTSGIVLLKNQSQPGNPGLKGSIGANLLDADLALKYKTTKNILFNVSARTSYQEPFSQNFTNNTFNRFLEANEKATTFSEQLIYYNDFTFSSVLPLNKFSVVNVNSYYLDDRIDYELYNSGIEFRDHLDANNLGLGLSYAYSRNQRIWDIQFTHSAFNMDYRRFLEQYPPGAEPKEDSAEYLELSQRFNQVRETTATLLRTYNRNPTHLFIWGSEYLHRKVYFKNHPDLNLPETAVLQLANENVFSFFGALKSNFSNRQLLELGLRYNYFHSIKTHRLEPRLNMTQFLTSKWAFQATFERKSQSIYRSNETINNSTDKTNNLWIGMGNSLYPLLKSTQYSLGLRHNSKTTVLELDSYKRWFDGVTTFSFGYLDPNDQDYHIGKSTIFGLDFFFQKKWNKANLWLSYTYQDNQNRFSDILTGKSFNSNFLVRNQLNFGYNVTYKKWHLHLNYNLRSGIPYSKPDEVIETASSHTFLYRNLNNHYLPSYQRIDLSLSKRFLFSKTLNTDLKISLRNVAKHKNVLERIHYYNVNTQTIEKIDRFAMIPFLNLGVRLNFK